MYHQRTSAGSLRRQWRRLSLRHWYLAHGPAGVGTFPARSVTSPQKARSAESSDSDPSQIPSSGFGGVQHWSVTVQGRGFRQGSEPCTHYAAFRSMCSRINETDYRASRCVQRATYSLTPVLVWLLGDRRHSPSAVMMRTPLERAGYMHIGIA